MVQNPHAGGAGGGAERTKVKLIHLEEHTGVELVSEDGRWQLYVSLVELPGDERFSHGFQVTSGKPLSIQPRADNSIIVTPEPSNTAKAARAALKGAK